MHINVIDISPATCDYLNVHHYSQGTFNHTSFSPNDTISQLAEQSAQRQQDAIFINIESPYEGSSRSELKGIELIFWLRLKYKYTGPIITYGFLSAAQILRLKPHYVVIHAPGNMHWRLGDELQVEDIPLPQSDLENISKGYREHLKPFINIQVIRHLKANFYALKNLKNIHEQITGKEIEIETHSNHTINELVYNSYYESNNRSIFEIEAQNRLKEKIEKVENDIYELGTLFEIKKGNKWQKNMAQHPYQAYLYFEECINLLDKEKVNVKDPRNRSFIESDYQARVNDRNKFKAYTDNAKNKIKQKEMYLAALKASLKNDSIEKIADDRINDLKEQIKKFERLEGKVVLVDDLADKGWYSFFNSLTGETIEIIKQELPNTKEDFRESEIAISILNKNPNLVLLDMRLFEGVENALFPSGIQILKEIRKHNTIIPIIVCSASNRGSVINQIYQAGSNFYWLKQGADLEMDFTEIIENYERIIHLLQTTLSLDQVQLQGLYTRFIDKVINSEEKLWWENKDWGYSHTVTNLTKEHYHEYIPNITFAKNDIMLHGLFISPLAKLSKEIMILGEDDKLDWIHCSSAITDLSNIIEYIHGFNSINTNRKNLLTLFGKYNLSLPEIDRRIIELGYVNLDSSGVSVKRKYGRNDTVGGKLYEVRNKASHYAGAATLSLTDVFNFANKLLDYLIKPNLSTNPMQYYEKNKMWYFDKDCNNILKTITK